MNRLKNFEEKNQQAYMSQYWKKTKVLYFMANRASKVEDVDQKMLRGVPDSYLTKTISYSKENGEKSSSPLSLIRPNFRKSLWIKGRT